MNFADLLHENVSPSLTNAATVTLIGAPEGYRTLAAAIQDGDLAVGDETTFKIEDGQGNWEFSTFRITNSTTLTRVSVNRTSNNNFVVTFPTGPKKIFNSPDGKFMSSVLATGAPVATAIEDLSAAMVQMVDSTGQKQISAADLANAISKEPGDLPALESAIVDSDKILVLRSGEMKLALASAIKTYTGGAAPADSTKPTLSNAQVANAAPAKVVLTFSETLGNWTPAAAAFAVSGGRTISLVERSGATITLTVNTAYVYGDVITVTYTKPGSNALQDTAGNQVDSFGPSAVTNNVAQAADAVKPTASSAAVSNATPSLVVITMSEPMDGTFDPATSAFTVSGHTVSAVDVTGSVINLTVTPAFVNGEAARTVGYTQPGTNQARDVAGNLLDSFSNLAITNNVAASDVVKPTATAAAVANATPNVVNITMSEPMDGSFDPAASAFTVSGHTVSAVDVTGSMINVTVAPAFVNGEAARTVSYTPPGTNNARDVAGNILDAFTNLAITNNVAAATPPTYTVKITDAAGATAAAQYPTAPITMTDSTDDYASPTARVYVLDANGNTPANVKALWGTSPTEPPSSGGTPITYATSGLPANTTGNVASKPGGFVALSKIGAWTTKGSTQYGLWGTTNLFAYGSAGLRYLWLYSDDGWVGVYDNATGTAISITLNAPGT